MECSKCKGKMEKEIMLTSGAVVGVRWNKGEPGILGAMVADKPKIIS